MKGIVIPIVCGASLFDCSVGNPIAYPDKAMGYNAAEDAMENNQMITSKFGVGTGAIVAVNAVDDVFEPNSNIPIAGIYDQVNMHRVFSEDIILNSDHVDSSPLANTTIACIITNANLNKAQTNKLASMTHDAYAHTIRPVHTSKDGDTIFAMCSSEVAVELDVVAILAIKPLEQVIVNVCKTAEAAYGLPSYTSLNKNPNA